MRRERLTVVANEPVGPYPLLRLARGGLDPGVPGQFFMVEAPGRVLPRPFSLCLAPPGELGVPRRPDRARHARDRGARGRRPACTCSARSATASTSTCERPLLVGGGIGIAPFPYLSAAARGAAGDPRLPHRGSTPRRPRSCRTPRSCSSPTLVTEALPADPGDVLACGPEPMLEAVRGARARTRSSPGRRRWPAATARATAASVSIDGALLARLCLEGPVLRGHRLGVAGAAA